MNKVYKHAPKVGNSSSARKIFGVSESDVITTDTLSDLVMSRRHTQKMNCIIGSLIVEENLWDSALALSYDTEPKVAFRISWSLEWAYTLKPEMIECRFAEFIVIFIDTDNSSVQRVFSKMLCDMTRRGTIVMSDSDAIAVAERCFGLLTCTDTPVAVKVWQIELLSDLSARIEWIDEHLTGIVRNMSENKECTPAIAATARHYFKRRKGQALKSESN